MGRIHQGQGHQAPIHACPPVPEFREGAVGGFLSPFLSLVDRTLDKTETSPPTTPRKDVDPDGS